MTLVTILSVRSRALASLLVAVVVIMVVGALMLRVRAASASAASVTTQLNVVRAMKDLPGRPLPDATLEGLGKDSVAVHSLAGKGPAVLWLLSGTDCLYCLAEVETWKEFARRNPRVQVVAVMNAASRRAVEDFVSSERIPFPVLRDSTGVFATSLSPFAIPTPLRVFALDGTVLFASQGSHEGQLGFLDAVESVYRDATVHPCATND